MTCRYIYILINQFDNSSHSSNKSIRRVQVQGHFDHKTTTKLDVPIVNTQNGVKTIKIILTINFDQSICQSVIVMIIFQLISRQLGDHLYNVSKKITIISS